MKQIKFMAFCLAAAMMSCGLTACSDDDDDDNGGNGNGATVKPETVFTAGIPASVDGSDIIINAEGKVSKIVSNYDIYNISYESVTFKGKKYDAVISCLEPSRADVEYCRFYVQLNNQGFITYALQEYLYEDEENEYDDWTFRYNADGQLNYMKRSEGDEETTITYTNGDITKVSAVDQEDSSNHYVTVISYSSNPVANKGGIMLFDQTFDIDMDEMAPAYYAGMLGKATKHLPTKAADMDNDGIYYTYDWTLNANGLPVKMVSSYHYPNGDSYVDDTYTFAW